MQDGSPLEDWLHRKIDELIGLALAGAISSLETLLSPATNDDQTAIASLPNSDRLANARGFGRLELLSKEFGAELHKDERSLLICQAWATTTAHELYIQLDTIAQFSGHDNYQSEMLRDIKMATQGFHESVSDALNVGFREAFDLPSDEDKRENECQLRLEKATKVAQAFCLALRAFDPSSFKEVGLQCDPVPEM